MSKELTLGSLFDGSGGFSHIDSAEYKMWGNGVALPNVCFVLAGIVHFFNKEQK